ncbi:MAG: efflux RND transporter permease subunit [Burkholderiales bacterium]
MWLTRVSIKNPYFATVIMLALILLGLVSIKRIPIEEFPNVKFPVVVVTTTYKGASPEVIETDVSKPLEEALNTLNGIKTVRSYSLEGQSTVVVEFNLSADPDLAVQDARDKVASTAATFRKEIDNPVVSKVNIRDNPIMSLAISSNSLPLREVTDWVNQVAKKRLQTVNGVGEVKLIGGVDRQIRINVEPYKLQSLGLAMRDIVKVIQSSNENYPAGDVQTKDKTINVHLQGKLQTPADFARVVVAYRNNVPIKISDVATVVDGQAEYNSLTLIDGKPAVGIDIRSTEGANLVAVAAGVFKVIDELAQIKPAGITISVTYDQSESVKASLNNVEHTLLEGALLTIAIVFLFLKSWRSTVITGLTLPIALIGTIFAIDACGFTLNMMSLLALTLSIGLLIDDAIVVRENIVRHLQLGKDHKTAALDGTNEIGLAVLATTLTIVAVFLPVGFMRGIIGKFFFQFGITVVVAVLISLLVSFTLDPMLSSVWQDPKQGGWLARSRIGKLLDWFEHGFTQLTQRYEQFIRLSLKYKKLTLGIASVILVASFMLVPLIGGEFIPKSDKGEYTVNFKTVVGSNIDYTTAKVTQVVNMLRANIPQINHISAGINKNFGNGPNNANLTINIGKKFFRHKTIDQIMQETRQLLSKVGGIEVQNIMPLGSAGGDNKPINVEISGDNVEVLKTIANELMHKIAQIKGVADLENSYQQVNPAYTINLNRDIASNLGVSTLDVGEVLSTLFAGNQVTTWEDPRNGQNYAVVIQIPKDERTSNVLDVLKVPSNKLDDNNLPILIPLSVIAQTSSGFSPRELDHINLRRQVTVTGNIEGKDNQAIFKKIQAILDSYRLPTGYSLTQSGSNQDMAESFGYAVSALMVGVAFIYMILAAQFRSFLLPLVIMVALPLSFVGVFLALFLLGSTLNMFSIIGIIMLMGLATKNGILLVDFINQDLSRGIPQLEAIVNAGKIRLRPIIMTTLAMIFGMLPLALSNGEGAEVQKSMAYAIIGGMITSTLLTLIVVPVLYVYVRQFGLYIKFKFAAEEKK